MKFSRHFNFANLEGPNFAMLKFCDFWENVKLLSLNFRDFIKKFIANLTKSLCQILNEMM